MKKFVALLKGEKRPEMNGKMMTPSFFELYTVVLDLNIGLRFFKNTVYTHNPFNKVIKF